MGFVEGVAVGLLHDPGCGQEERKREMRWVASVGLARQESGRLAG